MSKKQSFDVIVCGSLHLDIVVNAPSLPKIDETAVGSKWQQVCGGKGGNQAIQAARAGAKTAMLGRVGKDQFGQTLLHNLRENRVDVSAVSEDPHAGSGMSVAILQNDGDYGAVIVSGSNLKINPESCSEYWNRLHGAKILILQNEVPHEVNVAAAMVAKRSGARVVLNAAPARRLVHELAELVDVLVVNRVEAEMISGLPVTDRNSAKACLVALGANERSVVVTLGGGGLVLKGKGRHAVEIDALPVEVSSTHGAGDCFIGALCAELSKGFSLEQACRTANENAAAFVSRKL